MCQNIKQKEETWFNGLNDLMWNYPKLSYNYMELVMMIKITLMTK